MEESVQVLYAKALIRITELYGLEYTKSRIRDCWIGRSDFGEYVRFFFLFEGLDGESKNVPNHKGWKVYATIDVDKETFETTVVECILP